jgi:YidC/Oxa1 family membrane protein insertase
MKTEVRFLLAVLLMLGVLVGTNYLFPPVPPETPTPVDSVEVAGQDAADEGAAADPTVPVPDVADTGAPVLPEEALRDTAAGEGEAADDVVRADGAGLPAGEGAGREVTVEGPLYRHTFSTRGAELIAAEMLRYESFQDEGAVDLLPRDAHGYLGQKLVVGRDTVDLTRVLFDVEPADGLTLTEGGGPDTLRFTYRHPTQPFSFELAYVFQPDQYAATVEGRVRGLERPLLVTHLGDGLSFAEADSAQEARSMAYVANHARDGITSWNLDESEPRVVEGPLNWAAFRSKFFVLALLAHEEEEVVAEDDFLGGMLVGRSAIGERAEVEVTQTVAAAGDFAYRVFMGPQEYARLSDLGEDMEEVNPYGWKFFRPIVRPFVSIIIGILTFLHDNLSIGYGWVLVIFGVLMRVVFFPLHHKAMKAQLRNMAVQPLVQQIQKKHKDNPEKLQKEMMKLYKEHGFNPLAGCLPMLLPWPVLIALFFVFQNAIEFRGVEFLWLPDLSARDPLFLLPVFLGISMFLMQYVSYRSLDEPNPQLKIMMWVMPAMMVFIFLNLPSGLNLYYATANLATLPQQIWIAQERKKVKPIAVADS